MNGIVEVTNNVPSRILIAKNGSNQYRLPKRQIVGQLTPHAGLLPTEIMLCVVLGIEEKMDVNDRTNLFSRGEGKT